MRTNKFILDGHEPRPAELLEWAMWYETADRIVARDELPDGTRISTVFLGLDHSFTLSPIPILFETMVFAPPKDDDWGLEELDCERYGTWEQAEMGHHIMVAKWRANLTLGAEPPHA
jgi:hypothetical protein